MPRKSSSREKCKKCYGEIVKNGKRKTLYRGEIQRYRCKQCNEYTCDSDFPKKKYPREVISLVTCLYSNGVPASLTRSIICAQGYPIAESTPMYWTDVFGKFDDKTILHNLGERLHLDETQIVMSPKGKKLYFWALKCPKTKALVGHHLSERRTGEEVRKLLWKARQRFPVGYWPKAIRVDSFAGFRMAIRKVLGYEVKIEQFKSFKNHHNNDIETLFRFKNRFPRVRNVKQSSKRINIWSISYNRIQIHDTIKKTPGELCGLPPFILNDLTRIQNFQK